MDSEEEKMPGVISRGVRAPIVREGDDIVSVVCDSVERAMAEDGFTYDEILSHYYTGAVLASLS